MRYLSVLLVVIALAMTATAQFSITCDQNRVGDSATLNLANGFPNSFFVVCADKDPGPTSFPTVGLTVDLGFSSDFFVFEPGILGAGGTGSMAFGFTEPTAAGEPYFAQALNVDPMDIFNIIASNPLEAVVHPQDVAGGSVSNLSLADDSSMQVALGFSFDFFGTSYTQVFVNANGNLSFGSGNPSFFVTESFFLSGPPTIAPFWADFNPGLGGSVSTDATTLPGQAFSVSWSSLPHNIESGTSSATVTLFFNGDITIEFGSTNVSEMIVGITPGTAAAANPVDLSLPGFENNPAGTSAYEVFTPSNVFDLTGKLVSFAWDGSGYLSYY